MYKNGNRLFVVSFIEIDVLKEKVVISYMYSKIQEMSFGWQIETWIMKVTQKIMMKVQDPHVIHTVIVAKDQGHGPEVRSTETWLTVEEGIVTIPQLTYIHPLITHEGKERTLIHRLFVTKENQEERTEFTQTIIHFSVNQQDFQGHITVLLQDLDQNHMIVP